jgi:hypothetical protein
VNANRMTATVPNSTQSRSPSLPTGSRTRSTGEATFCVGGIGVIETERNSEDSSVGILDNASAPRNSAVGVG